MKYIVGNVAIQDLTPSVSRCLFVNWVIPFGLVYQTAILNRNLELFSSSIFYHQADHENGQPEGDAVCKDNRQIAYDNPMNNPEENPCGQGRYRP